MPYLKNIVLALVTVAFFSGCVSIKKENVQEMFQSNNAVEIKNDYKKITRLVISLKEKLDKRNPKAYDEDLASSIYTEIDSLEDNINLRFKNNKVGSYKSYLQIAFSKDDIKNRNDFLILGLYKNIYDAYDISSSYKITAFSYDKEKLLKLYKNLQILAWKIKVEKDLSDNYLFLTWQNNWQIELEKKVKAGLKPTWKDFENLAYIKNGEESIFGYSNLSFEHIILQMKARVGTTLERLGTEPTQMSLNTIKSLFIFL
ncbi:hypothetical protein LXN10_10660 [Arcobacter sp. KX21116]|uniref:hypothetical protein n=1 Tax=Arcobacter iocasae TaxID=2906515 RepID=UPI0035D4DC28